ncbi:MAG TPA: hypothetical protein VGX92_15510 [Pyrinomonadaceae bacterium]|jgi:hypothetical protein|nr:hypothetical protein [Pyrinomonadaceae bacterium]
MRIIKNKLPGLIVIAVTLGAMLCAYGLQAKSKSKIKGVTITSRIYGVKTDGTIVELGWKTTYISARGGWRTVKTSPDGKIEQILVADASRGGVFSLDTGKSEALKVAPFTPQDTAYMDAEGYRKHPQFAGEENLLGFKAFTQRMTTPEGKIDSELTFIPEFDIVPAKELHYLSDGSKRIVEPVSINVAEPADKYFHLPPGIATKDALLNQDHGQNR